MKTIALFSLLIVFLASCGGKLDLENDKEVKDVLNTTKRNGSFVYSSEKGAKDEFEIHLTFSDDTMTTTYYFDGVKSRVDKHAYTLGEYDDSKGRCIEMNRFGEYYLSSSDLIIYRDDNNIHHYRFAEN